MSLRVIAAGFAIVIPTLVPANAATVSELVTFSATPIQEFVGPSTPPVDPVTGSFIITFDPTQPYSDATGITSPNINIAVDYAWVFNYNPVTENLQVGGDFGETGVGCTGDNASCVRFSPATNDFWLYIDAFLTPDQAFNQLAYSQTSVGVANLYGTVDGTGTVTVTPAPTPLPGALPLLVSGLGGLSLLAWRRKRKSVTAAAAA